MILWLEDKASLEDKADEREYTGLRTDSSYTRLLDDLPLPIPVTKRHTMKTQSPFGQINIQEEKNTRVTDSWFAFLRPSLSDIYPIKILPTNHPTQNNEDATLWRMESSHIRSYYTKIKKCKLKCFTNVKLEGHNVLY